jgi:hypothetical protein
MKPRRLHKLTIFSKLDAAILFCLLQKLWGEMKREILAQSRRMMNAERAKVDAATFADDLPFAD